MNDQELRQAAIDLLLKAFRGDYSIPAHTIQAAVSTVAMSNAKP